MRFNSNLWASSLEVNVERLDDDKLQAPACPRCRGLLQLSGGGLKAATGLANNTELTAGHAGSQGLDLLLQVLIIEAHC